MITRRELEWRTYLLWRLNIHLARFFVWVCRNLTNKSIREQIVINAGVDATTGIYSGQDVTQLTFLDVLRRMR